MTTSAAGLGAAALEALRAATLAAHHAAGLCRSAKLFSAARTARTGEALLRSATALAGASTSSGAPNAQRQRPRQPRQPRSPGCADNEEARDGVIEPRPSSRARKTRRGKKKKKDKDCAMVPAQGKALPCGGSAFAPDIAAPDGEPFYASGSLDDSWADHVGGGVLPHVLADAAPFPGASPAPSGGARRVLAQRVSRERTPPPRGRKQIAVGDFVEINGLEKRTDLNGVCGSVIEVDAVDGRFAVQLVTSERIRVKETNLTLGGESSHFALARQSSVASLGSGKTLSAKKAS